MAANSRVLCSMVLLLAAIASPPAFAWEVDRLASLDIRSAPLAVDHFPQVFDPNSPLAGVANPAEGPNPMAEQARSATCLDTAQLASQFDSIRRNLGMLAKPELCVSHFPPAKDLALGRALLVSDRVRPGKVLWLALHGNVRSISDGALWAVAHYGGTLLLSGLDFPPETNAHTSPLSSVVCLLREQASLSNNSGRFDVIAINATLTGIPSEHDRTHEFHGAPQPIVSRDPTASFITVFTSIDSQRTATIAMVTLLNKSGLNVYVDPTSLGAGCARSSSSGGLRDRYSYELDTSAGDDVAQHEMIAHLIDAIENYSAHPDNSYVAPSGR